MGSAEKDLMRNKVPTHRMTRRAGSYGRLRRRFESASDPWQVAGPGAD
jgi:hypothetical protein